VAAVAAGQVACGIRAPAQGPAGAGETSADSEAEAAPSAPPAATRPPEPEVVSVPDATDDCFNDECAGVDMTRLRIGPAGMLPELSADPQTQDRLVFVVEFSEELAATEEFGVFLYFGLDEDPTTGEQPTDLPGVDRLIAASPPTTDSWTEALTPADDHRDTVRDPDLVSLRVEGNQLIFLVDPSLLAEDQGASPDAFVLYVIDSRSITNDDYFNGDGSS
jgi:hypothetical protein